MLVRPYTNSDKPRVLELFKLNTPENFAPSEEKDLVDYLNNHSDNYYVLKVDNKIVCCGGYNISEDPEVVRISWDIVDPQYQGKGFGGELTLYRIEKMSEIPGVKTLSVRTSQLAYKFYEKFGFVLKEKVKDFWAPGFDMYKMDRAKEKV